MAAVIRNPFSGGTALYASMVNQINNSKLGSSIADLGNIINTGRLSDLIANNGGNVDQSMTSLAMLATPQAQKMFEEQQALQRQDRGLDINQQNADTSYQNALLGHQDRVRGQDLTNSLGWANYGLNKNKFQFQRKDQYMQDMYRGAQVLQSYSKIESDAVRKAQLSGATPEQIQAIRNNIKQQYGWMTEGVQNKMSNYKNPLAAIAAVESNGSYTAANPNSSARGKYQHLNEIRKTAVARKWVKDDAEARTPAGQEKIQQHLMKEYDGQLAQLGVEPSDLNYLAIHQMGYPTFKKFVEGKLTTDDIKRISHLKSYKILTGKKKPTLVEALAKQQQPPPNPTEQLIAQQGQQPAQQTAQPGAATNLVHFIDGDTLVTPNKQRSRADFDAMETPGGDAMINPSYDTLQRLESQRNMLGEGKGYNDAATKGFQQSAALQLLIQNARRAKAGEAQWTAAEMRDMLSDVGMRDVRGADGVTRQAPINWYEQFGQDMPKIGGFDVPANELKDLGFNITPTGQKGVYGRSLDQWTLNGRPVGGMINQLTGNIEGGINNPMAGEVARFQQQAKQAEAMGDKELSRAATANADRAFIANPRLAQDTGTREPTEYVRDFYKRNPDAGRSVIKDVGREVVSKLAADPSIYGTKVAKRYLNNTIRAMEKAKLDTTRLERIRDSIDPYMSTESNIAYIAKDFKDNPEFDPNSWGMYKTGGGMNQRLTDFADTYMNKLGMNMGFDNWKTLAEPEYFRPLSAAWLKTFGEPISFKKLAGLMSNKDNMGRNMLMDDKAKGKLAEVLDRAAMLHRRYQTESVKDNIEYDLEMNEKLKNANKPGVIDALKNLGNL